jgi:hypothetical protein
MGYSEWGSGHEHASSSSGRRPADSLTCKLCHASHMMRITSREQLFRSGESFLAPIAANQSLPRDRGPSRGRRRPAHPPRNSTGREFHSGSLPSEVLRPVPSRIPPEEERRHWLEHVAPNRPGSRPDLDDGSSDTADAHRTGTDGPPPNAVRASTLRAERHDARIGAARVT